MTRSLVLVLCLLVCLHCGCGSRQSGVPTVAVSGTVYLNGQPLEGVEVQFVSENHAGYGKTDAQGKYKLTQGAEPGPNKVYFIKIEGSAFSENPEDGMDSGQFQAMNAETGIEPGTSQALMKQVIPAEYSDRNNPKIEIVIPEDGKKDADFEL